MLDPDQDGITADDLFASLRPDGIKHAQFSTVRRGLSPDQVRDYLTRLSFQQQELLDQIEAFKGQLSDSEARIAELETQQATASRDAYRELTERMGDVMRAADEHAERTRREAEEDAARSIDEATREAGQVRAEARSEADRMVAEAQDEVNRLLEEGEALIREAGIETQRILGSLSARRGDLLEELREIHGRLASLAGRLEEDVVRLEEGGDVVILPAPLLPLAGAKAGG